MLKITTNNHQLVSILDKPNRYSICILYNYAISATKPLFLILGPDRYELTKTNLLAVLI